MFSSLRGFLNRHKGKLIVTSAVVGGVTLAYKYAQKRLREWQEQEAKNFINLARKKQCFENTEKTCNQTVESLSISVTERVIQAVNTDEIISQLRENPHNKAELWDEMKILTFTKVSTAIYAYTILTVTLRIQLNVISGYLYKDSVNDQELAINSELQQKFLSLCHYFVSDGIEKLANLIKNKVKCVIDPISLKQKFTLKDTEQLFWSIQAALCADNADPLKQMVLFLISGSNDDRDDRFRHLLNETVDLIESDEVRSLSISAVSRGFSLLFDQIAEFYNFASTHRERKDADSFVNINSIELPLIKLIPIVNGLLNTPEDKEMPDLSRGLVQQLIYNDKLKLLGANIYEAFSD